MADLYSRLPPEEQKIVNAALLGAGATLWLAIAWEEPLVLIALPLLALGSFLLLRSTRRRSERHTDEWLH